MWELDHKDHTEGWALKNWCFYTVLLEKTLESPLNSNEIKPVSPKGKSTLNIHWKDWCWSSNPLATWCEDLTKWKRSWCWEGLRAGGEAGDRGWDGWMASLTQWPWVWANFGRWPKDRKAGVLQSMGVQRVEHDASTPVCLWPSEFRIRPSVLNEGSDLHSNLTDLWLLWFSCHIEANRGGKETIGWGTGHLGEGS